MGILLISVMNLLSLIMGVAALTMTFRLSQKNANPFLNNYLVFLILAILTGFSDWIVVNWVLVLVKGISMDTADLIYHIFWDLVGFPAYLFAFFYLVKATNHLAGIQMRRICNQLFITLIVIVIVLNYIGFYLRIKDSSYIFSKAIWMIYTFIWPLTFIAFLAFAYFRPVQNLKHRAPGYSEFVLLHFAGFLVWILLSWLPLNLGEGRHIIIFAFFLALFIPALYIYTRRNKFIVKLLTGTEKGLELSLRDYGFTNREIELAQLLMAGKSNQEISDEMYISLQTVKNYIAKMYRKAGVNSRTQFLGIFAKFPGPG